MCASPVVSGQPLDKTPQSLVIEARPLAQPAPKIVETEVFFAFSCPAKDDQCGKDLAEDFCRKSGTELVAWEAEQALSPDDGIKLFRLVKIVCRSGDKAQ